MFRILAFLALLLGPVLLWTAPASAAVTITFYSHKFQLIDGIRTDFPHGFVVMRGTTATGEPVNVHLGFSAKNIFIDVLWHPVEGALDDEALTDAYVDDSIRHFSFPITDEQVRAVMAVEHKWRTWPQPSYEIDTHNCVIFVKEIAVAAGLAVSDNAKFIHAPGDFLEDVAVRNAAITGRTVAAAPAGPPDISALQNRVQQLQRDADRQKAAAQ
ncbi:MAG: hypothetical protein JWP16_1290 [Alphaproteobacteria bacterium]|nr:hypothetical protein [Alphaproteobacteria bacterium]MDB5740250.1 hypothetical protein [Alphaproteobacteria bacterium]